MKKISTLIYGLILCAALLAGTTGVNADRGQLPPPRVLIMPAISPTMTMVANPSATPTAIVAAGGISFGWQGQIQCYNCAPFSSRVRLHHYDPTSGPINCWDWDKAKQYCYSATFSGIPWKAVWGFGAACPPEWKAGTWIDVEGVGAFICFDRGNLVTCDNQVCNVDLMGPGGAAWDGGLYDATLWVPLDPPRQ